MAHKCHAEGREAVVPPRLLMYRRHWGMVSKPLQNRVWEHYVPGQEIRKDPTPEYMEAQRAAIEDVAKKEGVARSLYVRRTVEKQPFGG